jgi:hypothetical protein
MRLSALPSIGSSVTIPSTATDPWTVGIPLANLIRAPFELGCKPARWSKIPAFAISSLYFVIAAMSLLSGITPASAFLFSYMLALAYLSTFLVHQVAVWLGSVELCGARLGSTA